MNSLESACSFAKVTPMPLDEFEQQGEPRLWIQVGVKLIVGRLRLLKAAKHLADALHPGNLARRDHLAANAKRGDAVLFEK